MALCVAICGLLTIYYVSGISGCCGPVQWESDDLYEAYYLNHDKISNIERGKVHISFDFGIKKIAMDIQRVSDGKLMPPVHILNDYAKGIRYYVENKKCQMANFTGDMPYHCVPVGAKLVSRTHFGAGTEMIDVDNYMLQLATINQTVLQTVSHNQCYPIQIRLTVSHPEGKFVSENVVYGTTLGIKDQHVFDVPAACQHAKMFNTKNKVTGYFIEYL